MSGPSDPWFDPRSREPEQARLQRQSLLYDPITRRALDAAGFEKGARVLELGSGAGDVAILLSDLVGPTGSVVGIERNADAVRAARDRLSGCGITNVEFVLGDIDDVVLDGAFDALVGRLILMYVPDPAGTLRRLSGFVRPGGIVCMLEISWDHLARPDTPLFAEIARIIGAAFKRTGAHIDMGERLHSTFRTAGLGPPALIYERPAGGSEQPLSEYLRDELIGLTPLLEREHLATPQELGLDTLVERLDTDTDQTDGIVTLWPMIGAWVRCRN